MTRTEAINLISKHCSKSYSELKKEIKLKDKTPCLELLVMRVMESAIAKADLKKLDWIFYQMFGKPKEINNEDRERTIHLKYSISNGEENGSKKQASERSNENS